MYVKTLLLSLTWFLYKLNWNWRMDLEGTIVISYKIEWFIVWCKDRVDVWPAENNSFQNENYLQIFREKWKSHTLILFFGEWSFNSLLSAILSFHQPCSFLGTWRSGEGNARDYGSSVTGPSACYERVKLMARRGVGGLRSLCCRPWKWMPFIADWPSQAVAGGLSPDVLSGEPRGGVFAWISS